MSAASVTVLPRRIPPTILVAEGDALIRCSVSDALRSRGFKVVEAASAHEALTVLDTMRVDLLFADIHLPGSRGGLDIARHATERPPSIQIILTSGRDDPAPAADIASLGSFVRKPYDIPQLVELVTQCLNWPETSPTGSGNKG